jgi:hypothetical protein
MFRSKDGKPLKFALRFDGECKDGTRTGGADEKDAREERIRMHFCNRSLAKDRALQAMKRARARIAADSNLTGSVRAEILEGLDDEIAELQNDD